MDILRALFLSNSNKENTSAVEPIKTTADQSIEFMSKLDLRILSWELRINYHKNKETASALPLPIQKWLKQQQEQFPHADWIINQVEKLILDEIKDSPAAIKEIVSKAADQRKRDQPAAKAPTQAKVPKDADSIDRCPQVKPVRGCPPGNTYPLAHNERNPFHNFANLQFNKKKILGVFGMECDASPNDSGSSSEEENRTPSNGFHDMPRDWNEVIIKEEEEVNVPAVHNAIAQLISPLPQAGVPVSTAAAVMAHPQPQEMMVAPANIHYVAANGQNPAQVVNNNGNIWQPLHGVPAWQLNQQHTPLIYTPCIQQQQPQQELFPGPTGEGFRVIGGHPPQHQQYQQQQGQYINPQGFLPYQYEHGPQHYQPVAANRHRQETEQEMRKRLQKFYNGYYKRHYENQMKAYQRQCQQQQQAQYQPQQAMSQQQQPPAPRRPQPLVEQRQQHQEAAQGNTPYVSAQVIDMGGAEYANVSIHQVDRLPDNWFASYQTAFGDFCNDLMPRLGNKFVLGASSAKIECINAIGSGVNGDIHVVQYLEEPPASAPKPIQYVMKKVRFANYVQCKETHVIGKKMALHLGAEEEVFGLTLDHPNLMKLHQVFLNQDDLNLEIIMPRMTASLSKLGSVLRQENAFPYEEKVVWYIMHEFLQGLAYLHGNGRFHGDIKPANILVTETGEIKLTDFGLCGRIDEVCHHLRGTPLYLAPEVAATEFDSYAKYGYKSDMYSAGIMMYELAVGDPLSEGCPFDYEGLHSQQGWKWLASREPVITKDVSSQYKELLTLLLHRDPNERPSPIFLLENTEFFNDFRFLQKKEVAKLKFINLIKVYASIEVMNKV
ncbi:uncharacterized protein ATC70_009762 [Mucor velutinosus]|uniref:Protein kinase domain-containing protein n=1 Tax=Mucor velutinosus TaxID=708070 RepID=A0AAN7DLD6_9FUNG|nr:hypothetical protein ATC70_009762 [Mucor velutinosus]